MMIQFRDALVSKVASIKWRVQRHITKILWF